MFHVQQCTLSPIVPQAHSLQARFARRFLRGDSIRFRMLEDRPKYVLAVWEDIRLLHGGLGDWYGTVDERLQPYLGHSLLERRRQSVLPQIPHKRFQQERQLV